MDVSQWTPQKVMQLPDHFFGNRWYVGIMLNIGGATTKYQISEEALPEWCVIWALFITTTLPASGLQLRVTLRLGHKEPTTDAQLVALPLLFPGLGRLAINDEFHPLTVQAIQLPYIRKLVHSAGRRVVMSVQNQGGAGTRIRMALLISSLPKVIPDELLSPRLEHVEQRLDEIWKRIKL